MRKTFFMATLLLVLVAAAACGKSEERAVYSSGQVTIRNTFSCDLDQGVEASDYSTADFEWSNSPPHYLEPVHYATFSVLNTGDFDSVSYDDLTGYYYSGNILWAYQIPVGAVVGCITNQGRYCKFRIDANANDLTITWVTYEL